MVKTIEELEASGLKGDELARFYAEGELTLGELADFVAKFPESRSAPVLVNGETCPYLALTVSTDKPESLLLISKSVFLGSTNG